jgi:hypothetical protein
MGIKVNVSRQEAESKVLEPVPSGWYRVTVSDIDVKEVSNAPAPGKTDNRGKPYYAIECTISEGEHEGRKLFTNAMCFDGALYTITQLMKATGFEVNEGDLEIPDHEAFLGEECFAKVSVQPKRTVKINGEEKTFDARNDVKGFRSLEEHNTAPAAAKATSLLPS